MVVRADNKAYGEKACKFLGEKLGGKGKVVEFQGALSSVNGRDRSEAFAACMKKDFPGITVFEEPTDWEGAKASAALQTRLNQHPDINGIYMQAGGVFLAPTLQVLRAEEPAASRRPTRSTSSSSPTTASRRSWRRSARARSTRPSRSRPTSTRKWALFYAKAAVEGKTFQPGKTDHDSIIVDVGGGRLEDQLPGTADHQGERRRQGVLGQPDLMAEFARRRCRHRQRSRVA